MSRRPAPRGGLLLLALLWALAPFGQGTHAGGGRGASQLRGLSLRVTLPYSEYGPGVPIRVMCTFRNRGGETLTLALPSEAVALVRSEGRDLTYAALSKPEGAPRAPKLRTVTLGPGENFTWDFTIRPGRRDLLPGDYPLTARVALPAPPASVGDGARRVSGTLLSNEATLRIRYNVLWVG